jgi:hypothetical protein
MTKVIYIHGEGCDSERGYIVRWLFEDIFGLNLAFRKGDSKTHRIEVEGDDNSSLTLPDVFFAEYNDKWLSLDSLPATPLRELSLSAFPEARAAIQHNQVPVLYGAIHQAGVAFCENGRVAELALDIFGSLFFLMSRYEEVVVPDRDVHGRFPLAASVLAKDGLLGRAIGNEYIEILWAALKRVWPKLERKPREFCMSPTHDIDHPSKSWSTWRTCLRSSAGHVARGRVGAGVNTLIERMRYGIARNWESDPYDCISWLCEIASANQAKATFYYIPEQTHPTIDRGMPIHHPHVVDQWRRIHDAGHEIGVHPGYGTYQSKEKIISGTQLIKNQLESLGCVQPRLGGRQHYLRWDCEQTARYYVKAGLSHDSSLGFAEQPGFRTGLCYEHPMYDVVSRQPLDLVERPLALMDVTLTNPKYLDLGLGDEAFDLAVSVKRECQKYRGDFTLLWHNNYFVDVREREFYSNLLSV